MNLSRTFAFDENVVRVAGTPENPLFVAADACRILGITDASQTVEKFLDTEKGTYEIRTLGGPQVMLVVTEAGLYRLIFRSNKPAARKFQDWVFSEVLPTIRKTGVYGRENEERVRLWEALKVAQSPEIQRILLAALGIAPEASSALRTASEPTSTRNCIVEETLRAEAVELIRAHNRASVRLLQEHMHIGFPRATRIMKALELEGIVGIRRLGQPREILKPAPTI